MEEQFKRLSTDYEIIEPKEGERRRLNCISVSTRSPSLDIIPNAPFVTEEMQLDYLAKILVDIFLEQKK
jgi:hypothetical protein